MCAYRLGVVSETLVDFLGDLGRDMDLHHPTRGPGIQIARVHGLIFHLGLKLGLAKPNSRMIARKTSGTPTETPVWPPPSGGGYRPLYGPSGDVVLTLIKLNS